MCILCVDVVHVEVHNGAVNAPDKRRTTALWIRTLIGDRTLIDAAADISAVTNWSLDHSRLSRYANPEGTAHIGPKVVGHFTEYARVRRLPALDLTEPKPEESIEERQLAATLAQADAIQALVDELRAWRTEDRARIGGLENLTQALALQLQPAPAGEARTAPRAPGQ
jgi:hypothetical protein